MSYLLRGVCCGIVLSRVKLTFAHMYFLFFFIFSFPVCDIMPSFIFYSLY